MTESSTIYDVIIIGSGPAGLTAAIYTSRANLKTLVITGSQTGGQLTITTDVENFPGFEEGIQGPELMKKMIVQAKNYSTEFIDDNVEKITGTWQNNFEVSTKTTNFKAKSIITASGASAKWLGLDNEQRLMGRGVSACATCDGYFFKNKTVAVVGGGDASMEEAIFLTNFASKVYLIARAEEGKLRASKIMQKRALENNRIEFLLNSEVTDIFGKDRVEGLKIKNKKTNEEHTLNDIQGLFVAIGHTPNTQFLNSFVELDDKEYVKVTDNTKTSVEGVFAAGDVHDFRYRQAITAAGYGCMAALDVIRFLESKGREVNIPNYGN